MYFGFIFDLVSNNMSKRLISIAILINYAQNKDCLKHFYIVEKKYIFRVVTALVQHSTTNAASASVASEPPSRPRRPPSFSVIFPVRAAVCCAAVSDRPRVAHCWCSYLVRPAGRRAASSLCVCVVIGAAFRSQVLYCVHVLPRLHENKTT